MLVYLNGEFLPQETACVPVNDRSFLFGDGIYEVIRVSSGVMFEPEAHLERMEYGLRGIRIRLPKDTNPERLLELSRMLLERNGLQAGEATVYLQVTRGTAPRTHAFPSVATPATVYLSTARFHPLLELQRVGAAAITLPDIRWSRCDLKTVNLLPNVLGKQQAAEAGAFEAIFLRDGAVTEGASTNVFGVIDGEIRTFPSCTYILSGITRAVVLELIAERGLPFRETPILAGELPRLQELFVTGTTTDVQPIVRLDGRPIGDGAPGPITALLQEALLAQVQGHGVLSAEAR